MFQTAPSSGGAFKAAGTSNSFAHNNASQMAHSAARRLATAKGPGRLQRRSSGLQSGLHAQHKALVLLEIPDLDVENHISRHLKTLPRSEIGHLSGNGLTSEAQPCGSSPRRLAMMRSTTRLGSVAVIKCRIRSGVIW